MPYIVLLIAVALLTGCVANQEIDGKCTMTRKATTAFGCLIEEMTMECDSDGRAKDTIGVE